MNELICSKKSHAPMMHKASREKRHVCFKFEQTENRNASSKNLKFEREQFLCQVLQGEVLCLSNLPVDKK
jgi:hypothetical protein